MVSSSATGRKIQFLAQGLGYCKHTGPWTYTWLQVRLQKYRGGPYGKWYGVGPMPYLVCGSERYP